MHDPDPTEFDVALATTASPERDGIVDRLLALDGMNFELACRAGALFEEMLKDNEEANASSSFKPAADAAELLHILTEGNSPIAAGLLAHVLAFRAGLTTFRSQNEMASKLNTCSSRFTAVLKANLHKLPGLSAE